MTWLKYEAPTGQIRLKRRFRDEIWSALKFLSLLEIVTLRTMLNFGYDAPKTIKTGVSFKDWMFREIHWLPISEKMPHVLIAELPVPEIGIG